MKRNLEARVEVVVPIEDKKLQQRLREILDVQLTNKRSVWDMKTTEPMSKDSQARETDPRTVQEICIELAEQRLASSPMAKKKKQKKSNKRANRKNATDRPAGLTAYDFLPYNMIKGTLTQARYLFLASLKPALHRTVRHSG